MRNLYAASKELLGLVAQHNPDKLVIDLRQNSGGDYTVGERWLIHPIRELASINRKGHLFVLVGAVTFSAAMNNAAQFHSQTAALLVGQTIGEKPNSYAEPRNMTLPNSHLTVRYSTRYYKFSEGPENAIRPDREIAPSWADYKAGRDPVLEWVLNSDPKHL
jgi:C-terminal processing protease CtpA/Prc